MKRFLYFLLISLIVSNNVFSYQAELILDYSCRQAASPFAKVQVIDCRSISYITNSGNAIINPEFQGSITDSIAQFFLPATTSATPNTELKIFLYSLELIENDDVENTDGSLHILMRFFYNAGLGQYVELAGVDTFYSMTALNVSQLLLSSASMHLCEIATSLTPLNLTPGTRPYSAEEIDHLDSIEKMQLPIYNAEKINEGVYKSYADFMLDSPVKEDVYIDTTARGTVIANIITPKGKKWIRQKDTAYIISNGILSAIRIEGKFYLLKKEGSDFCFYINDVDYTKSNKAGMIFGLTGLIVANAAGINDVYSNKYKIDHYTGNPILISSTKTNRKDRKK